MARGKQVLAPVGNSMNDILSQLPTIEEVQAQIETARDTLRKLETLRGALAAMEANYPSDYMPRESPVDIGELTDRAC